MKKNYLNTVDIYKQGAEVCDVFTQLQTIKTSITIVNYVNKDVPQYFIKKLLSDINKQLDILLEKLDDVSFILINNDNYEELKNIIGLTLVESE